MKQGHQQINDAIRRAAGRLPPLTERPAQVEAQGHGSADGGAGQNQSSATTTAAKMNQLIRDKAKGV